MTREVSVRGRKVTFLITTLCSYGTTGDFEAIPTENLQLDAAELGRRLKDEGCGPVRTHGRRLVLSLGGAELMVFETGRIILERVSPDSQAAAADLVARLMALLPGSNDS